MNGWGMLCGGIETDIEGEGLHSLRYLRNECPDGLRAALPCSRSSLPVGRYESNRRGESDPTSTVFIKMGHWPILINGGEGGIRTLDRVYLYTLSRRAPSTTRTPLLEVTHPATPKRPSPLLPLLPSGPGGVHSISPQGDQVGHHRAAYPSGIEVRMKLKGAPFERTDDGPIDDR